MASLKIMLLRLWQGIGIRLVPALLLIGVSCYFMAKVASSAHPLTAFPKVLLSMSLLLMACIIIAPRMARILVEKVADFFMYSEKFDRPQPMYGKASALRKNRQYEEAIAAYEEIAEAYPDEIKPWLEMIDLVLRDLRDPARAELIYQRALLQF